MRERLLFVDNLKGFAILLVVLGHCIQLCNQGDYYMLLWEIIYSFHMPLFMALSGFVGFKISISLKDSLLKRFIRLLIPYLFWGGISIFLHKLNPLLLLTSPDSFLWFLYDLFIISFIVNIVVVFTRGDNKRIIEYLVILSVIMLVLGKFIPFNICNIKSLCWMFQFYVAGVLCKLYIDNNPTNKYIIIVLLLLFVICFIIKREYSVEGIGGYLISEILAYSACALCFILFKSFVGMNTFLVYLGQSTLGIYACHQELIRLIGISNVWINFIVALSVSYFFVLIIRKIKYLKFTIGE